MEFQSKIEELNLKVKKQSKGKQWPKRVIARLKGRGKNMKVKKGVVMLLAYEVSQRPCLS